VWAVVAVPAQERRQLQPAVRQLPQVGGHLVLVRPDTGQQPRGQPRAAHPTGQLGELLHHAVAHEGGQEVQPHHLLEPRLGVTDQSQAAVPVQRRHAGQRDTAPPPQLGEVRVVPSP